MVIDSFGKTLVQPQLELFSKEKIGINFPFLPFFLNPEIIIIKKKLEKMSLTSNPNMTPSEVLQLNLNDSALDLLNAAIASHQVKPDNNNNNKESDSAKSENEEYMNNKEESSSPESTSSHGIMNFF